SSRDLQSAAGASEDRKPLPVGWGSFGSSTGTPRPMFVASTSDRRQVSWLADRRLALPSRRRKQPPVAHVDETSRLQLRGQLRLRNRSSAPHSLFAL